VHKAVAIAPICSMSLRLLLLTQIVSQLLSEYTLQTMLQVSNLSLTRELERAERMLKAQMAINRDLHLELEEHAKRTETDRRGVCKKLSDFEALALQRLAKCQELEVLLLYLHLLCTSLYIRCLLCVHCKGVCSGMVVCSAYTV
jgi:hypothetical protein